MASSDVDLAGAPRWRGQRHRLEVHYLTATDAATGAGLWLHHEVVAPAGDDPFAHGWLATFPVDGPPSYERFGPHPVSTRDDAWFAAGSVTMTARAAVGTAAGRRWDLAWRTDADPLWTFPRWVWRRQLLPAAQVLPTPVTEITGSVDGAPFTGPGGIAHIFGHGNAQRWVWLHADLGGGDVLELVAATARRPGLRALRPLPLLQLRTGGRDWPRDPLLAAPLLRARIRSDGFTVGGTVGRRRVRASVDLPADRCVTVGYTDPDGATATCINSARADVTVTTERRGSGGWRPEREWRLDATGHAEVGTRP